MTDKLELKSSHEVVDTVYVANIESIFHGKPTDPDVLTVLMKDGKRLYCDEVCPMQEEPVSEDLGNYINELSKQFPEVSFAKLSRIAVRVAKWQKEYMIAKAIDGEIFEMEDNDYAICLHIHLELCIEPDTLEKSGFKDRDKVKVIVIKED